MCSYDTTQMPLAGSAKRESGWTGISSANIYCACPVHALLEETVNIDFIVKNNPGERVAIELGIESAKAFAHAILATIKKEMHAHEH